MSIGAEAPADARRILHGRQERQRNLAIEERVADRVLRGADADARRRQDRRALRRSTPATITSASRSALRSLDPLPVVLRGLPARRVDRLPRSTSAPVSSRTTTYQRSTPAVLSSQTKVGATLSGGNSVPSQRIGDAQARVRGGVGRNGGGDLLGVGSRSRSTAGQQRARAASGGDHDRTASPGMSRDLRCPAASGKQRHGPPSRRAARGGRAAPRPARRGSRRSRARGSIARSTGASAGFLQVRDPGHQVREAGALPREQRRDVVQHAIDLRREVARRGRSAPPRRCSRCPRRRASPCSRRRRGDRARSRRRSSSASLRVGVDIGVDVERTRGAQRCDGSRNSRAISGNGPPWTPVLAGSRSMPRLLEELAPGGVQGGVVAVDVAQMDPGADDVAELQAARVRAGAPPRRTCSRPARRRWRRRRRRSTMWSDVWSPRRTRRRAGPRAAVARARRLGAYVLRRPCVASSGNDRGGRELEGDEARIERRLLDERQAAGHGRSVRAPRAPGSGHRARWAGRAGRRAGRASRWRGRRRTPGDRSSSVARFR